MESLVAPQSNRRRLQAWLTAIAATTLLVLVVGGVTRLTHSGLSIVDWRPLIGAIPPLNQADWVESFERYQQFPEYRQLRPQMTLADYKQIFFWEYLHRLLARLIGLVFLIPFVYFSLTGSLRRPMVYGLLALFGLGSMQGVAGWLMVHSGLIDRPSVSHFRLAVHLVLALAIIGLCIWLIRELAPPPRTCVTATAKRRSTRALYVVGALLGLQIVWGAFVAGLKAGYVFTTFPLMGGTLAPIASWTLRPVALNFVQEPSAVQWTHRLLGTALVIAAYVLQARIRRMEMDRTSRRLGVALLWAVAAQYALGVWTLVYIMPIGVALAHQTMAAVIVSLWVYMVHHVRHLEISSPLDSTCALTGRRSMSFAGDRR